MCVAFRGTGSLMVTALFLVLVEHRGIEFPYHARKVLREQRADDDEEDQQAEEEIDDSQFGHLNHLADWFPQSGRLTLPLRVLAPDERPGLIHCADRSLQLGVQQGVQHLLEARPRP